MSSAIALSPPMSEAPTQERKPRVLFIDDEPRILLALRAIFRADYDVVTANSGANALAVLREQDVDVIVSDQRMPGMTGVEVLREARNLRPRAIRLLLTGYSDLTAIVGSINDGEVFRFVNKPWSNTELRATLDSAVKASKVAHVVEVEASNASAAPVAKNPGTLGVLVIDDDQATRDSLRRALDGRYSVHFASSLDESISVLEQHRIGIVIAESAVGGKVVTPLLAGLRQHHPTLIAIVLTAHADAQLAVQLINSSQIYRLLQKPINETLLRGTVNMASQRFQALKANPEQVQRMAPVALPPQEQTGGIMARLKKLFLG